MNVTTINSIRISLFGHSSVCIEAPNLVIYSDPYVVPKGAKQADIILHTHGHFDHCVIPNSILKPNTTILASRGCKHPGQTVDAGQNLKFSGMVIQVVDAYNVNKPFHRRGEGVGYILHIVSGQLTTKIYLAGDTDRIPEMKNFKCDVAILPIGGTYTMDLNEAAQAAVDLKARIIIPYHYNYLSDQKTDPQAFKQAVAALAPNADVRILIP